ncbi:sigma-70 family RNA polymerase sigma factor [Paenibacillus kribbensis]|uniref:sigma-70 family RNA polymerase sigma factor n=1 Tax=Paenibacillus kribbensis TaxID=172713 RepID=UPI002DB9515D|nr:sigma-70 family RNA polymerase sigma factor [Paenibacillus kribbensis]MEC0234432.1 sigma-70 family RNA polymerase sigma factor [Paenibacillus kribbensis]
MTSSYNPHLGERDVVIQENMGLVYYIANKFRGSVNQGIDLDDLVSEGTIGLLKAFEYFDPTRVEGGVKFATYAYHMIKGCIMQFIRSKGSCVKVPPSILNTIGALNKLNIVDTPSPELIAEQTGCTLEHANRVTQHVHSFGVTSLDQPIGDSEDSALRIDLLPTQADFTAINVEEFINSFDSRERILIRRRMEGETLQSIGTEIGVSQVHASRLVARVGERLKKYMEKGEGVAISRNDVRLSILDGVEWFSNIATSSPSIGINSAGFSINGAAAKVMGLSAGDYVQVGFNDKKDLLVFKKAKSGVLLSKTTGKSGSITVNRKRLGFWLESKDIVHKRYEPQAAEGEGLYYIQLERTKK